MVLTATDEARSPPLPDIARVEETFAPLRKSRIALELIAFVVIATGMAHRFWEFTDPGQYNAQLNNFLKNIAVIGGLLMYVNYGAGSASVDKR